MKAYILSIAGVVLISAVVSIIAPNGKMGKFIRGAVKLVGLVVLLTPFVSLFQGKGFSFESARFDTDETYLQRCVALMEERDEEEIQTFLQETFSVTAEAAVKRETDSVFSVKIIQIKISDFGINGEGEHINIVDQIKEALLKKYGVTAEIL